MQPEPIVEALSGRGARLRSVRPPSFAPLRERQALVYEIAVAPPADGAAFSIERIEVRDGSRPLASVDASAIAASTLVRGVDLFPVNPPPSTIAAGQEAVVFMMHEVPSGQEMADRLDANVSLRYADGQTEVASLAVPILPVAPVILGPPLRGGPWVAINALSNTSIHRRAIQPFPEVHVPERYAIDYMLIDEAGKLTRPPGTANDDFLGYGKELLAVGDGTIAAVRDGLPDLTPGKGPDPATLTAENIAGNMVILSLDQGGHVFYAHLRPGEVRVKVNDRVKKGDVLGLLGNSGNTDSPHLHIHVCDRPDPLDSEGVPFVFESYSYLGKITDGTVDGLQWDTRANEPSKRALPVELEVNGF